MHSQEIKGNLARLLATENLIVEHRKVSTASFDVDRRILILPNWDRASSVVYDMLVGHEVGHALFTPNEDWRNAADCPKDFINVIEDARIEKLMKRKYPGLRKSFAGGYRELNDKDFFGIADEDLSTLSLIDRINLHFKCGADALIPFSIEEKVFVARTDLAETFEEVLQIAQDVYNFSQQEKVADVQPPQQPCGETESNDGEETEQQQPEQSDGEDDQDQPDAMPQQSPTNQKNPQEDDEDCEEDEDDGVSGGDHATTQRNFNDAAEELTNRYASSHTYVEIPDKVNLSNFVADWTEVTEWIDQHQDDREGAYDDVDSSYREFRKGSQKEVNYLVKEFECRKSADAYARAGQSKTGVLDTSKLHTYRYNEDIFKKVTVLPDGKNHGLLFVLDWSGSMQYELLATVKQLINLTSFCKKVQIPFEVYAFTNEWWVVDRQKTGQPEHISNDEYFRKQGCEEGKVFLSEGLFHMMNMISSRSNTKDYERMCLNLYREAYQYVRHTAYHSTPGVGLSGTPLNEAIVMLNYIIPEFKKQNDLQKVNVCVLTDGESCNASYGIKLYNDFKDEYYVRPRRFEYGVIVRDRKTGMTYPPADQLGSITNIFVRQVRDRNPGVNVIGFRIMSGSYLSNFVSTYADPTHYSEVQKQWKKEKSAVIPFPKGFTALYVMSNKSLDTKDDFNVESGAQKGEISRAFKKMLKNKSTNKKLLSSFIEYVS